MSDELAAVGATTAARQLAEQAEFYRDTRRDYIEHAVQERLADEFGELLRDEGERP